MISFTDVVKGLVRIIESGYTVRTGKLLGRFSPATGQIEEITLGTGLALTGDTLSSSGGAGGVSSVEQALVNDDTETLTGGPITTSGTLTRTAVDAGSDKLIFWDDSAGKKVYAILGTNLSFTGTTLNASGGGGAGTVTSVDQSLANDDTETLSGGPVTGTGTLARTAVDAGSDKIQGWDDSAGKKIYFALGTGLSTSGTTLNATPAVTHTGMMLLGDQVTTLTTGTKLTTTFPAITITELTIFLATASTSGSVVVDVKDDGTTIFSTKPIIDATETDSSTGTPAVISAGTIANLSRLTFIVDAAGTGAKGLGLFYSYTKP